MIEQPDIAAMAQVPEQIEVLFLDDNIDRWSVFAAHAKDARWAETAAAAIHLLECSWFEEIHLDHDLQGMIYQSSADTTSGMEVVRHIVRNGMRHPGAKIILHSHNINAALEMFDALDSAGYQVCYQPFGIETPIDIDRMRMNIAMGRAFWFGQDGTINCLEIPPCTTSP